MGPLEFMSAFGGWCLSAWHWLWTPSVCPCVGVVAAIAAAFALEPTRWLKPWKCVSRASKIALTWLLVALFLSALVKWGIGSGDGTSGGSGRAGSVPAGAGSGGSGSPEKRGSGGGSTSLEIPDNPDIVCVIAFPPTAEDPIKAEPFSCQIVSRTLGSDSPSEIHATSMIELEHRLRDLLQKMSVPKDVTHPEVHVRRVPFPGENVLRKVQLIAGDALPFAEVLVDE